MRNNGLHLFLQTCNGRRLFLHFALFFDKRFVLFQELIKQHRIHLIVAHAVGFSVCIVDH